MTAPKKKPAALRGWKCPCTPFHTIVSPLCPLCGRSREAWGASSGSAAFDQAFAALMADVNRRLGEFDLAKAEFDERLRILEGKLGIGPRFHA
jgi:hypothetical protein